MELQVALPACQKGELYPLGCRAGDRGIAADAPLPENGIVAAGTVFTDAASGEPFFQAAGSVWLPGDGARGICRHPLLLALRGIVPGPASLQSHKHGYSLAVITLSDKGARGLRRDESGPLLASLAASALPLCLCQNFLLPDDAAQLRALVAELALGQQYDMVFTTGGTGLAERDITPQAVAPLIDTELPGFTAAMLAESLKHTPNAAISRAVTGLAGKCLVITFPGSVKAVRENMAAILPALPHALKKIHGDTTDCGV